MDLFKAFATDSVAELEGVIVEYGDAKLRIARQGNPAYRKTMNELVKRHKAVLDTKGEAAEACATDLTIEVMSRHILLGWEGFEYKGAPLPYSRAKAYEMLKAHPDFRDFVSEAANEMERYKIAEDEADVKN